ncbi:hypothetical protein TWF696_009433 [Orbilia brochopaga]|uniref:F-box domain-containing protein n=1 Tax=Orbilia brochopaga TaxID=3140254 RepID=A0AAV9UAL1_9PEZI
MADLLAPGDEHDDEYDDDEFDSDEEDDEYDEDFDEEDDEEHDELDDLDDYDDLFDGEDLSHKITISDYRNGADRSFIGRMPDDVMGEILGYLDQPDIMRYSRVSTWCCAAAQSVYYRKIRLTARSVNHLRRHQGAWDEVRQVHYNISVSTGSAARDITTVGNIASILSNLPKVHVLIVTGIRNQATTRAFFRFLRIFQPHSELREIQIAIGDQESGQYVRWRNLDTGEAESPDWNTLHQARRAHPNLEKISIKFGPWACALMRLDIFTRQFVVPHLSTLKVLEVKLLEQKDLDNDIPDRLKHYPFHSTREAIIRAIQATGQNLATLEARLKFKDAFNLENFKKFQSPVLGIFRYYSELKVPSDDDITLENVCEVFPNLRQLDFVTRASWRRSYKDLELPAPMAQLGVISLPGVSEGGVGAEFFIDLFNHDSIEELARAPKPAQTPKDITQRLVGSVFPHVYKFCWYQRMLQDVTEPPWTAMKGEIRFRRLVVQTGNHGLIASGTADTPIGPATATATVGLVPGDFELVMWWGYNRVEYRAFVRNRYVGKGARMLWTYRS